MNAQPFWSPRPSTAYWTPNPHAPAPSSGARFSRVKYASQSSGASPSPVDDTSTPPRSRVRARRPRPSRSSTAHRVDAAFGVAVTAASACKFRARCGVCEPNRNRTGARGAPEASFDPPVDASTAAIASARGAQRDSHHDATASSRPCGSLPPSTARAAGAKSATPTPAVCLHLVASFGGRRLTIEENAGVAGRARAAYRSPRGGNRHFSGALAVVTSRASPASSATCSRSIPSPPRRSATAGRSSSRHREIVHGDDTRVEATGVGFLGEVAGDLDGVRAVRGGRRGGNRSDRDPEVGAAAPAPGASLAREATAAEEASCARFSPVTAPDLRIFAMSAPLPVMRRRRGSARSAAAGRGGKGRQTTREASLLGCARGRGRATDATDAPSPSARSRPCPRRRARVASLT